MKKIFFLLLVGLVALSLQTQATNIKYLRSGIHQVLEDNTLYRIPFDSLVLNMTRMEGASPLTIDSGNTAVIELRNGQVLEVFGSNAFIQTDVPAKCYAAYPGIRIAAGATLVVFGNGEVIAHGGQAAAGTFGQNGTSGQVNYSIFAGGNGGAGGHGGNGSAPGIGGHAGSGGDGGAMMKAFSGPLRGNHSNDGQDGTSGEDMGTLMLIGNIHVHSEAGRGTPFVQYFATRGANCYFYDHGYFFSAGFGGGGGNGGAADAARYDIGGGAPGAGGGGSGACGGVVSGDEEHIPVYTGAGGRGGDSFDPELSGCHGEGEPDCIGGLGGHPGAYGANGAILMTDNVVLNASIDPDSRSIITSVDQIPEAVRQLMSRKVVGANWTDGQHELPLFYNQEMPQTPVVVPVDESKGNFLGYVDQYGKVVYDAAGTLAVDTVDHSINFFYDSIASRLFVTPNDSVQLHARWSGVKSIHVVRYVENPNFSGNSADPKRYTTSDQIYADVFTVANVEHDTTLTISLFANHAGQVVVDSTLYVYAGSADNDSVVLNIPESDSIITLALMFDGKKYALSYEGLDDDIMSNQCINIDTYTRAGNLSLGKVINFPAFRQWQGHALKGWEHKDADGNYVPFTEEVMPAENLVLRPVFEDVLFHTTVVSNGNGEVSVFVVNGNDTICVDSLPGIPYHANILVSTVAAPKYLRVKAEVKRSTSGEHVETELTDSTITFPMPDDDALILIENMYHPHKTLTVLKMTESSLGAENIVYHVSKDNQTFYTNDNDYYQFSEDKLAGTIADLEFAVGDRLWLHTDYKNDDGSRESSLYVLRNSKDAASITEIRKSQIGSSDSTYYFYQITVDSVMMETDVPIEILWSNPRTPYHIETVSCQTASISAIYSNGRNISTTAIAYMNDPIEFMVASQDSMFTTNNIIMEYFDGYDQILLNGGVNASGTGSFLLTMPESDVRITLTDSAQYSISAISPRSGAILSAPMRAAVGYPVICTIRYADDVEVPADEDIHIYVNGVEVDSSPSLRCESIIKNHDTMWELDESDSRFRTKTFIMPACNAVVSLEAGETAVETITQDKPQGVEAVYNILGQKVAEMQNGRVVRGTMPKGVVIINGNKYLNK